MRERSAVVLVGLLLPLLCWVLPATGRRRKTATESIRNVMTGKNVKQHGHRADWVPCRRRSPYSTDRAPLDGSASPLVRPYLPDLMDLAPETASPRTARVRPYSSARERAVRLRRRTVAVLAADFGIDADTRDIHALLSGVSAR
ncbi:hypothetical protein [Streptomyces sp. NPDC047042]|uniref:hypothetical protein n=1 Tax=Streptomyces sp. NPDC047042 TaxID=3154807 RepID=UPI0033D7E893